ncbi:MAG: DUF1905 domain-containing protein [Candidatus Pacebacteria bacterium]|nr:DUF1905 domain-containing protein [Candidatus Paceibacterota bacterium]MCF7862813.1 DUF1905 domain-containing protein [Candidatus Paceibacterota bacterium]
MIKNNYKIKSQVWVYPGETANWHFVNVPKKESDEIKKNFGPQKGVRQRGWGSVSVSVSIGKTSWKTSIFPDKRSGTYLLPLKAEVRKKEGIYDKDKINFTIKILPK